MDFNELRATITGSRPTEWRKINRIGPTYRDRFGSWTGPDGSGVEHDAHPNLAVFKPNLDITIAYGMEENRHDRGELSFEWSKNFPDTEIRGIGLIDVFWRGSLVDRINYVYVDGARAMVPLGWGNQGLQITDFERDFVHLVDRIEGHHEFDRYVGQIPYEPRAGDW